MDMFVTPSLRFGGALGLSSGRTERTATDDRGDTRTLAPSAYGEFDNGRWSVGGGVGYAGHRVTTARGIQVGPIDRRAGAEYDAAQYSGLMRLGVAVPGTPAG